MSPDKGANTLRQAAAASVEVAGFAEETRGLPGCLPRGMVVPQYRRNRVLKDCYGAKCLW